MVKDATLIDDLETQIAATPNTLLERALAEIKRLRALVGCAEEPLTFAEVRQFARKSTDERIQAKWPRGQEPS